MFTNPFAMMLGGLLILSPIIIHLINRIRYKRVRWAAMEFLLKAQKRSRRKLIIEQMILLLLRIILVLATGFLLARFLGCGGLEEKRLATRHLILIDDTPSMGDRSVNADGKTSTAFEMAQKAVLEKIAGAAAQAPSPQYVEVMFLSDLDNPKYFERINTTSLDQLKDYLNRTPEGKERTPSAVRVELEKGLAKARERLETVADMKRVLHVVSDFRSADWNTNSENSLREQFEALRNDGIDYYLFDAASPERGDTGAPRHSDNLAIVDLVPDNRIVNNKQVVEFSISVANFSPSEKKDVMVRLRVDGVDRREGSVSIKSIRPNETAIGRVAIALENEAAKAGESADPMTDALGAFHVVSAHLEPDAGGLEIDNMRYTVVEVRNKIPILLVESSPANPPERRNQCYYLWKYFTPPNNRAFDVQIRTAAELEKINLQPFASVMLLDLPESSGQGVPNRGLSPQAIQNLEQYVRSGGGLMFFMGPSSTTKDSAKFYDDMLFKKGDGLLPAPIDLNAPVANPSAEEAKDFHAMMIGTLGKKLHIPLAMRTHHALDKFYEEVRLGIGKKESDLDEYEQSLFINPIFTRYARLQQGWQKQTAASGTQVLIYLPNTRPIVDYKEETRKLMDRLENTIFKEGAGRDLREPKFEKYKATVEEYRKGIINIIENTQTNLLTLDMFGIYPLLYDRGDAEHASMREFWQYPELADLRKDLQDYYDRIHYGFPFLLAKPFGKGRVLAYMGAAGGYESDSDYWQQSDKGFFPVLMKSLQHYLGGAGTDASPSVGDPFLLKLEQDAYQGSCKHWLATVDPAPAKDARPMNLKSTGSTVLDADGKQLKLNYRDTRQPGVYMVGLMEMISAEQTKDHLPSTRPDIRAAAYNVNAKLEGNLARATSDDIKRYAGVKQVHTYAANDLGRLLAQKRPDWSEQWWVYLAMLLLLIAEQAMAVRLSFHAQSGHDDGSPTAVATGHGIMVQ